LENSKLSRQDSKILPKQSAFNSEYGQKQEDKGGKTSKPGQVEETEERTVALKRSKSSSK